MLERLALRSDRLRAVMPASRASFFLRAFSIKGVDGRDKPGRAADKWLNMIRQHSSFNSPRSVIIAEETSLAAAAPVPEAR